MLDDRSKHKNVREMRRLRQEDHWSCPKIAEMFETTNSVNDSALKHGACSCGGVS